jgi:hypothetical protein
LVSLSFLLQTGVRARMKAEQLIFISFWWSEAAGVAPLTALTDEASVYPDFVTYAPLDGAHAPDTVQSHVFREAGSSYCGRPERDDSCRGEQHR